MGSFRSSNNLKQIRSQFDEISRIDSSERYDLLNKVLQKDNSFLDDVHTLIKENQLDPPVDLLSEIQIRALNTAKLVKGQTIAHYKILKKLGGGGMGIVYKARDTKLDRFVALKFLPPYFNNNEEAKTRFIHEAKTASALDHPNICTIYEIGESDEGLLYIAMAFYKGETLKKKIERGTLNIKEATKYAIEIATGLKRAHEAGIIHRDIKPANIMVTDQGHLKILDFGLAKIQNINLTQLGSTLGTIAYMSPEQTQGREVDKRTDIWSLGIVYYEMLTGERPFKGDYEQAVIYDILNSDPVPIEEKRPEVPQSIAGIINTMLMKDLSERYSDIDDLLTDFQKISEDWGIGDNTLPLKSTRRSTWHKSKLVAGIILLVSATIIALMIVYDSSSIPFDERDWILITDIENNTGDEIFDHSLNRALAVSIGQSQFVNVFPDRRIQESLVRMKQEDVERIDASLGNEIAQREGIPIVLIPSINQIGDTYAITGELQYPETGEMLSSNIFYASGKDEVLAALDKLAVEIRQELGETVSSIEDRSKPLAQVTTASLDALKQYAIGNELQIKGYVPKAKNYFEQALELDSTFTAARASLGMLHLEMSQYFPGFNPALGRELLTEAVQQVDKLTDLEKYGILAFYAQAVEQDLEKAANYHQTLMKLYPDYPQVYNNLGRVYWFMGRYEEAEQTFKKGIRIAPSMSLLYVNLNAFYAYETGKLDSAYVWSRRHVELKPDNYYAHDYMGWVYLGLDSLKQAEFEFKRALEINPSFVSDLYRLGHTYRLQGLFEKALEPISQVLMIDSSAYHAHEQLGILYYLMDRKKEGKQHFKEFKNSAKKVLEINSNDVNNRFYLARALAYLGEVEEARRMGKQALAIDSTLYFEHALLLSVLGEKKAALDKLEQAINSGFKNYIWMKIHPNLEPLYEEPRFKALLSDNLNG